MIRNVLRGLVMAVLVAACSDSAPTTAPLAPSARAASSLGLAQDATADTIAIGTTLQLSTTLTSSLTSGGSVALVSRADGLCADARSGASPMFFVGTAACVAGSASQSWSMGAVGQPGPIKGAGGTVCLDNWGARGKAGDLVGTWTCVPGAPSQTWTLTSAGELQMSNGMCVQSAGGGQLTLQYCSGDAAQRWNTSGSAGTAATLSWTSSVPSVATVSGTGLVTAVGVGSTLITVTNGASSEVATIVVAAAGTSEAGALTNVASSQCMAVAGDQQVIGIPVTVLACAGTSGQRWTLPASGTAGAVTAFAGAICLDDWGAKGNVGDAVGTWRCVTGAPSQSWSLTAAGELKGINGLCVQAGAAGTQLTLQACSGATSQRWTQGTVLAPAPVDTPATTTPSTTTPSGPVSSTAPELPRLTVDTRMPAQTGRVIAVPAGGDLQAALNAAQPGDVVTLANGATYRGNFVLPNKPTGGWIVVRPADLGGIATEGQRIAPAQQGAQMPKIVSPNGMFALATPDAYANTGTRGWRFVGLEIASNEASSVAQAIVELGTGVETSTSTQPSHIVFDRVWIHGRPEQYVQRCLTINSAHTAVVDSYFSDCHTRGGEGQVIGGWSTPGPLKIENNYLEGGTIGMLLGGADPRVQGLIPSDITVRRNHFFKPLSWRGVYQVKNAFELKNAQRVLVEGNVFENNWMDAQSGYLILFTPLSQDNLAPWSTVRDVTFRYNVLRNSPQGFQIAARTSYGTTAQLTDVGRRIAIEHNVLDRIGGRTFLVYKETQDITIAHNVLSNADYTSLLLLGEPTVGPVQRLVFRDNLVGRGYGLVLGDGTGQGQDALNVYAPDAVIAGNVAYSTTEAGLGPVWLYPNNLNAFVASAGLAGISSATIGGVTVPNAQVTSSSPYYRVGTGGSTPGADLAAVESATAGVIQR